MVPVVRSMAAFVSLFVLAAILGPTTAGQVKLAPLDFHGDPLPDGAIARHGDARIWHSSIITQLGFTPDGKGLLSLSRDLAFHKWDLTTGKEVWQFDRKALPFSQMVRNIRYESVREGPNRRMVQRNIYSDTWSTVLASHCADGKLLAVVDSDNAALVLNSATGKQLHKFQLKSTARAIALSPSGKLLAVCEADNEGTRNIRLWDLGTQKELPSPIHPKGYSANVLQFSSDERRIAGCSSNNLVRLWDVSTGQRLGLQEHDGPVSGIAFSQDGCLIASASVDGSVRIWDMASEAEVKRFESSGVRFQVVSFAPDKKSVVAGDSAGDLHFWDLATGGEKTLKGHSAWISALAFSPQGGKIASASSSGSISIWDTFTGQDQQIVKQPEQLCGFGVCDGGHSLALCTASGQIRHIETLTGFEFHTAKAPNHDRDLTFKFAPDCQTAVWIPTDDERIPQAIVFWDAVAGVELKKLPVQTYAVNSVAFSQDGQLLFSAEAGNLVRVRKVSTGKEILRLNNMRGEGGAFSPDGKLLAVFTGPDELCIIEMATGKQRCKLRTLCNNADAALSFSPNGRLLATTADNGICLWDLATAKPLRGLYGHQSMVTAVAFSPRGDVLASGGADGAVRLWQTDTGKELRCFEGHQGAIQRLVFSDDGKMLISSAADQCVLVWDAASRAAVKQVGPSAKSLERCWTDLASDDATVAFKAMGEMISLPKDAVALLSQKLQPVPPVEAGLIDKLIADLDSANFAARQKATKELEKLQGLASPALNTVLAQPPSAEVQNRAKTLLEQLEVQERTPEELRVTRAVEVLERISTPGARDLLTRLAKGAPGARLTMEADQSLPRLPR